MKIAFVNERMFGYASGAPDAVGGSERQQWYLARALAASGWNVVVANANALRPGERRVLAGVEFVGVDRTRTLLAWYRFLSAERPDWWYWRGAGHLYGPAVALARRAGVRSVFAVAFDRDVSPRHALARRRAWWPLYLWGLASTDRILAQHKGQLAALPAHWHAKARMVPSMADPVLETKSHRERSGHIAWVAMLRQPKRPDILIEVARRLPHARFVVCGGPTHHRSPHGYGERIAAALRQLPNVDFLGQVGPARAQQVIEDAGLLLSTSEEEGFPNTFLEAWTRGTPVVSLTVDPGEHIRLKGLGAVSGNLETLAADIAALLRSPRRRDDIAGRAREHVARAHSAEIVVAAIERALQDAPPQAACIRDRHDVTSALR